MKTNKLINYGSILFLSLLSLQTIQAEELSQQEEIPLAEVAETNLPIEPSYIGGEQTFEEVGIQESEEIISSDDIELISYFSNIEVIDRGILLPQVYRLRDDLLIDPYVLDPAFFQPWDKYYNPNSLYFRNENTTIQSANTFYNLAEGNLDIAQTMLHIFNQLKVYKANIDHIEAQLIVFKNHLLSCQGMPVCVPLHNDRGCSIVSNGKKYYFDCGKAKLAFNFGKDIGIFKLSSDYIQDTTLKQYVKTYLDKVEGFVDRLLLVNFSDQLSINDPNDYKYMSDQFANPDIINAINRRKQALLQVMNYYNNVIYVYVTNHP